MNDSRTKKQALNRPNILIITVDQERYPTVYENDEIKLWREEFLRAQRFLENNGLKFERHYIASSACSPSRTSLYTGQYPSLHGVSQTTGAAKDDFDPDMFWLDPNTVPTMGDYFEAAGYQTFWKGKWHASQQDILIPDTHDSYLSYNNENGFPIRSNIDIYLNANRLKDYGFSSWVGPEPFGDQPHNTGSSAAIGVSGRDQFYAEETIQLIQSLDTAQSSNSSPWFIMCSFVDPHDIALFGAYSRIYPLYNFSVDSSVPDIPKAPTADEDLSSKPTAQLSYKETYPLALQPLEDTLFYRQLYYSLMLRVDREMQRVLRAIRNSSFYENTIIVFTSDHGELLGAHGGLYQKWYQAYEETVHVPFIIHNPILFNESKSTETLTNHVDILPTLLGLAGIDQADILELLKTSHTEARELVGRDLSEFVTNGPYDILLDSPVYFMTDDDFTKGLNQISFLGEPYTSVIQPNSVQTVIAYLNTGKDNTDELWKYSIYFDNPQFWSTPGCQDVTTTSPSTNTKCQTTDCSLVKTSTKCIPLLSQIEFYNLTTDPLEEYNLADPKYSTPETEAAAGALRKLLQEQCLQKRLYPQSGNVPGRPNCPSCSEDYPL